VIIEAFEPKRLKLVAGKSVVIKSSVPISRISEPNQEIATAIALSPKEIYVTGKTAGITNLMLWQNKKLASIYDIEVSYDISRLKENLNQQLPEEKELQVLATNESITLAGRVTNAINLTKAVNLAQAFAPDGKVNNLVAVGGVHQVMLEVRVSEISRATMKRLGINFIYQRGQDFAINRLNGLTTQTIENGIIDTVFAPNVSALFRFGFNTATWTSFIDALQEDGLIKVLAEPTLITLSGKEAQFLAGGEFPYPVPQSGFANIFTIEFKEFGVRLRFTPNVLDNGHINIEVAPEVSDLDFTNAVQFSGFIIPGLTTRRASTVVELADGQSFAVAGLLKDNVRDSLSKYPMLGDIPILGALFRSRDFQKDRTELLIIVTPHLVKPLDTAKQPLPTDFYNEPNDFEIYLGGMLEGSEKPGTTSVKGRLDGEFGYVLPSENN
jgi:pilus assembly protein CpaC